MEITELKERVNKAEQDILQILNRLTFDTGIQTQSIELTSFNSHTKTRLTVTSITDVKITITL